MRYEFYLFTNLLIPIICIIVGVTLVFFTPKKINSFIGYRTTRSMKNNETWKFAQKHSGLIQLILGIILFIITIIIYYYYQDATVSTLSTLHTVFTIIQLLVLICSIIPTEIILKKKFDNK